MKRFSLSLLSVSIFAMMPVIAGAAGTYYNGNTYQNSQRYGSGGGYYNSYGAGRYGQTQTVTSRNTMTRVTKKSATQQRSTSTKKGFQIGASLIHEFANWDIEMDKAGSKLRYDGVAWNVLSADGVYYFDTSTPMQLNFGARYGKQFGETSMIDDDISNESMWDVTQMKVNNQLENVLIGTPAMSVGSSKNGTQTGFNVSFGLTDFFKFGNMKVTPSLGYRYFKHKLSTEKNYGVMVNVVNSNSFVNCLEVQPGEIQCIPYVGFADGNGIVSGYAGFAISDTYVQGSTGVFNDVNGNTVYIYTNSDGSLVINNNTGAAQIDVGETYYYEQSGKSHVYETTWAGPYLALDMEYAINNTNNVTAGIELGLPMYDSKGDQPYRVDWAHPTSVEDKGGFGDAYHLGLNAAWSTAITDSTMFTFGLTYDYYNAKKADATTYLNSARYEEIYDSWKETYDVYANMIANNVTLTETQQAIYNVAAANVSYLQSLKSAGWKQESKDEIKSIYSSMGIRMGINVKF